MYVIFLICSFLISQKVFAADLLVDLPYGQIEGRVLTSPANVDFRAFQGIPYAAAPVGNLRFQPPEPPEKWNGTRKTVKDGNICYSIKRDSDDENEDCLFVNVFTPVLTNTDDTKLAVMVWIYGGAYRTGSSKYSNFGPDYLIEKDVVVVTLNYRLGPFGFLATEDGLISGNAGLKDQAAAIQWVHDHIELFGGDPEKVTIFGQSAGGSSVGYQLLYKKNEGLFRGAILQSGSPLSLFSYMGDISARAYAFDLAKQIDATLDFQNDTRLLLDFLLSVKGKQIDVASTLTTVTSRPLPVIEVPNDRAIITKESYELLEAGEFLKVPIIVGTTSEEDIGAATDLDQMEESRAACEKDHTKLIPKDFKLKDGVNKSDVGTTIYNLYFDGVSDENKLGHYFQYKSHDEYTRPMIKHADLASQYTDVYFYIFSHDGPMGNFNITVPGAEYVGHSEDTKYIWKVTSSDYENGDLSKFPEGDVLAHKRIIELWTNFAKYLNPTPEPSELLQNIRWPKVSSDNYQYLDIGDNLSVQKDPKGKYYKAWTKYYDDWAKRPFTTY
ncbi:juvenile hormone esterase-like [Rhynchophorus ferrugineus]|uniref:juvenile hormone esterase-like n=1 Tax=Rhynchophorus ferrugineus TaxID=354439 RepID=UPI003FCC8927